MPSGGKREGAGRKPFSKEEKRKQRSIWLTDEEWEYLGKSINFLGGSKSEKVRNIVISKIEEDTKQRSV